MNNITKKLTCILLLSALLLALLPACSNQEQDKATDTSSKAETQEIPEIKISWGNDLHTAIPYVPVKKGEQFKEKGVYLNPLSEDKFEYIQSSASSRVGSFSISLVWHI